MERLNEVLKVFVGMKKDDNYNSAFLDAGIRCFGRGEGVFEYRKASRRKIIEMGLMSFSV